LADQGNGLVGRAELYVMAAAVVSFIVIARMPETADRRLIECRCIETWRWR
jgi:hypothetical protein